MEVIELIGKRQIAIERKKIFEELYEQIFPYAARFVRKMGGSLDDARDIFQDALVIFYEKNTEENFIVHKNQDAYVIGIVKHLWIRKYKQDRSKVSFSDWEHKIEIPENYFPSYNTALLLQFLEKSGKKCLDLLRAFYYEKLCMNEISGLLGYKNERSATVQKYKCIEKLREAIKEKSKGYEDFTD